MTCPKCGSEDLKNRGDDGEYFPTCEDCGFVQYDEDTLALQEEVRREYEEAKRECWPDKPPATYKEWVERDTREPK